MSLADAIAALKWGADRKDGCSVQISPEMCRAALVPLESEVNARKVLEDIASGAALTVQLIGNIEKRVTAAEYARAYLEEMAAQEVG